MPVDDTDHGTSMEIVTEMTVSAPAGDRSEPRRMYVRHATVWSPPSAGAGELDARTVFMARLAQVYQRVIAARAAVESVPAEIVPGLASTSIESAQLPMARLAAKLARWEAAGESDRDRFHVLRVAASDSGKGRTMKQRWLSLLGSVRVIAKPDSAPTRQPHNIYEMGNRTYETS